MSRKFYEHCETPEDVRNHCLNAGCHIGQANDEYNRFKNIQEHGQESICERCDGTGNELYSMYRACKDCGGSGLKPTS